MSKNNKDDTLNVKNANEAFYCLSKGTNSKAINVTEIARRALLYYISNTEESAYEQEN